MRSPYSHRDDMEKAGIGGDWTQKTGDDSITAAKAVKDKNATSIPYALYAGVGASTGTANHSFVPLVWAYGGDIIDKTSGKWIGDSPAVRKALDYYQRAYSGGLTPKEILTTTKPWTSMREKEGNGQLALLFEGGWVYGGLEGGEKTQNRRKGEFGPDPPRSGGPALNHCGAA